MMYYNYLKLIMKQWNGYLIHLNFIYKLKRYYLKKINKIQINFFIKQIYIEEEMKEYFNH